MVEEITVRGAMGGYKVGGNDPTIVEGRLRKKEVKNDQWHAGVIQEQAEVNAGGYEKLRNAVQRGAVKQAGGLFFFPERGVRGVGDVRGSPRRD